MGTSSFSVRFGKEANSSHVQPTSTPRPPRRMLSRRNSPPATPSTTPSRSSSMSLHNIFHSRPTSPANRMRPISDEECWERMLDLQMEYHCYKSARLEAAVEARRGGCPIEDIRRPSRLCLDLLNEEYAAKLEAEQGISLLM